MSEEKERAYKKPQGRPTDLTEEIQRKIVTAISIGNYMETAASYVGVSKVTLYDWLKRGNKGEEPYKTFLNAVEKAMAEAEMLDLETIRKASRTNWQAAAWRLERKFPDKWGRRDKMQLEHSGRDGKPIEVNQTVDLSKLSTDQLRALEQIAQVAKGEGSEDG